MRGSSPNRRSLLCVTRAACSIPIPIARVHAEETLLAAEFGAAYEDYRARTWRPVPGLC